jgi:hypothetical protein
MAASQSAHPNEGLLPSAKWARREDAIFRIRLNGYPSGNPFSEQAAERSISAFTVNQQ